jgi:hypothetical protein
MEPSLTEVGRTRTIVDTRARAPGLREVVLIWSLLGAVTLAVFTTYARVSVSALYHVSGTGLHGAASHTLVYLNFPIAIIALALIGFTLARLFAIPNALSRRGRWAVGALALVAVALCLVAGAPGVVTQKNLDGKPINLIPALGVALAAGLTIFTTRRTGLGSTRRWSSGDRVRVAAVIVLAALAFPWILALLGVYVGDIPLVGSWFISKEILAGDPLPAVHVGDHHGFSGVLFAVGAILLSRALPAIDVRWLRRSLAGFVALMLVYGLTNAAQDFWGEQLVKRGTTTVEFPSVIVPALTPAWGLIILGALVVWVLLLRITSEGRTSAGPLAGGWTGAEMPM